MNRIIRGDAILAKQLTEPMYQPKAEGDHSSRFRNVAAQKILGPDENDGGSEQWLNNSTWNLHQLQSRHGQCDRVRDRK